MRGKIVAGKVIVTRGRAVKDGRDGKGFPLLKLNLGTSQIVIDKEKNPANLANCDKLTPSICPDLAAWRELNIPAWRRILVESIQAGDEGREKYARRMLKEVLKVQEVSDIG